MESSDTLLYFIREAAQRLLKEGIDGTVMDLIGSAKIMADGLLVNKAVCEEILLAGTKVVTTLFMNAKNLYQLIVEILENENHKQLKNTYKEFIRFITEIKLEIKNRVDDIKKLTKNIKEKVNTINDVKKDELHAFIDGLSIHVRTIDIEIQSCKRKIEFVLKELKDFALSVKEAENKDMIITYINCVAAAVAPTVLLPLTSISGVIAGLATLELYNGYIERSNERSQGELALKFEEKQFKNMMCDLINCETEIKNYAKMAEDYRKHARPPS